MSKKLELLFIRHGQTQDNIDTVLQGHRDTSLTDQGLQEAEVLAQRLRDYNVDVVYHSPLKRITQTLAPFLANRPGLETHIDPDLRGQYLADLEGQSYDVIDMSSPRSADSHPGVELFNDFVARLKRSLARIIAREAAVLGSDVHARSVMIATHGVCITSIFRALENIPPCDGFNRKLAVRGPDAYEVRWTDSDDVAKMAVDVGRLPIDGEDLDWGRVEGEPFVIEKWGKREKAL